VFSIPIKALPKLFSDGVKVPRYLAYIEWFTPFSQPDPHHLMYKVTRSITQDGERVSSVIPLSQIHRSAHLLPKFGPSAPAEWTSSNVLEMCPTFFVNSFNDRHFYRIVH
jgi:hypothetical protein